MYKIPPAHLDENGIPTRDRKKRIMRHYDILRKYSVAGYPFQRLFVVGRSAKIYPESSEIIGNYRNNIDRKLHHEGLRFLSHTFPKTIDKP